MTRYDAEALLRDAKGDRQAVMTGGGVACSRSARAWRRSALDARYTSADFFPMFDVPFLARQRRGRGRGRSPRPRRGDRARR